MLSYLLLLISVGSVFGEEGLSDNIARGKPTWQTGVHVEAVSDRAVDGIKTSNFESKSCTHTDLRTNPYWVVDLEKSYHVTGVSITNRANWTYKRLTNYDVVVTDTRPQGDNPTYGPAEICIHRSSYHSGTLLMKCTREVKGRYVMIRLKYREYLTLCEVEVFGTLGEGQSHNIARGKPTWQTGVHVAAVSSRAVDGNANTDFSGNSCTHTDLRDKPYWAVDLERSYHVTGVSITNRANWTSSRLTNYDVVVTNTRPQGDNPTYGPTDICIHRSSSHAGTLLLECTREVKGRYVMIRLKYREYLSLCEVEVFGKSITQK